jgi:hypothetical protein
MAVQVSTHQFLEQQSCTGQVARVETTHSLATHLAAVQLGKVQGLLRWPIVVVVVPMVLVLLVANYHLVAQVW